MEKNWIICFLLWIHCAESEPSRPSYQIDDPLLEPIAFAGGQITTTNGIAFSKNGMELYTSKNLDLAFDDGRKYAGIFLHHFQNGSWSEGKHIDLGSNLDAYHPVLSHDDQELYFNSRSKLNQPEMRIPHNIWRSRMTINGWSKPEMIVEVNSASYDSYPSIAGNGNLYFNSDRPGGKGGMDIFVAHAGNGKFQEPINLEVLNSSESENDLVVDVNEGFIIFNRYIESTNEVDLFIAHRVGGVWTAPRALVEINRPGEWELTPSISPDGRYFFYELNQKIMQVDINVLLAGSSH